MKEEGGREGKEGSGAEPQRAEPGRAGGAAAAAGGGGGGGGLSLGADRCGLRAAMEADGSQATSGGPGEAQHDPG